MGFHEGYSVHHVHETKKHLYIHDMQSLANPLSREFTGFALVMVLRKDD